MKRKPEYPIKVKKLPKSYHRKSDKYKLAKRLTELACYFVIVCDILIVLYLVVSLSVNCYRKYQKSLTYIETMNELCDQATEIEEDYYENSRVIHDTVKEIASKHTDVNDREWREISMYIGNYMSNTENLTKSEYNQEVDLLVYFYWDTLYDDSDVHSLLSERLYLTTQRDEFMDKLKRDDTN